MEAKSTIAAGTPGHLLRLIRSGEATTRAELALTTGLARSTIAQRIDSLAANGWIKDDGEAPSTGGRPPTVLGFNEDSGIVLVGDVGATHSRVALANLGGKIVRETTADIEIASGPDYVLSWVYETFRRLLGDVGDTLTNVVGVGIGLPIRMQFAEGRPVSPPIWPGPPVTPGWEGYDVRGYFADRFDVPVLVDNDVHIMALGEHWAMESKIDDFMFVKVGTGIGSGLIIGGQMHRGAQGTAGDIGHIQVAGFDAVCKCGNRGCIESVASGAALARQLAALGKNTAGSRDVVELVRSGDPDASQAVREAGRLLGGVLAPAVNLINPAMIMIGGDISNAGEELLAGVREIVYRRSTPLATNELVITSAAIGDRAGVVGAAAMVIEHILDPSAIDASLAADALA